ncbi:N5-carboxyaminoimidazole ribonucleotide mutase [Marinitoga sp. 1135]|uniref:5-(carboxyamino)imidazole ribonucleotide mutase n=1 Tax=unclassified Marinitoga TaxID=2640159 RepID=UPI00095064D6|nr:MULTISPECIES: 5-(carboxyamino)imidazole ribonucleotide mutase [unclassified Marinitoga]APT75332.1 N5-carboxyaminoimidazole ribonucleotide mutase [Marinitoga sp. 1137]NUU95063.1 N5-carboxyaminoimidazole ribonucleotide mutase [Marinitoga sp. 1135]NUU97017.1 N5-carboxyaminoimidazole ribonucleotide mutase [Marinitoga sp. 1138]
MSKVLIIAGSKSDETFVKQALDLFDEWGIEYEFKIYSAHRNLKELTEFLSTLSSEFKVIIAVAGLAAALPGVVASLTTLPVIGVPNAVGPLNGVDALLSIVQMPKGVPVGTMGIGNHGMKNAAYFAKRILDLEGKK